MVAPIGFPQVRPLELALPRVSAPTVVEAPPRVDFATRVTEMLEQANDTSRQADSLAETFAQGGHGDVHGTMIALQEADINLRLVANVRNRVIEAYREVMRMGG